MWAMKPGARGARGEGEEEEGCEVYRRDVAVCRVEVVDRLMRRA